MLTVECDVRAAHDGVHCARDDEQVVQNHVERDVLFEKSSE